MNTGFSFAADLIALIVNLVLLVADLRKMQQAKKSADIVGVVYHGFFAVIWAIFLLIYSGGHS